MTHDPFLTSVLFGCFLALGIASEHIRIRWAMKRKRQRRFSMSYRKDPEPQLARWTAEHGRSAWR